MNDIETVRNLLSENISTVQLVLVYSDSAIISMRGSDLSILLIYNIHWYGNLGKLN